MLDFPANPTLDQQFIAAGVIWIWDGAKWQANGFSTPYLPLAGGTLSGPLVLAADPTAALQATTKEYVDNADNAIWGTGALAGGFVNKIRNPGFEIWQRGNVTAAANTTSYTADGWQITTVGAACAVALGGKIAGSVGSRSITLAAAAGLTTCNLLQRIESYMAAHLGGRTCTIQAYINNNTANAITPQLVIYYPTVADVFTSVGTEVPLVSLQTIPANSVGRICYTFNASTNAIYGYQVVLQFGNSLNLASGSIVVADVDLRSTPNLPLGLNSSPPLVEIRPIGIELGLCQRYFERSYDIGTATGAVTNAGMFQFFINGLASITQGIILSDSFEVTKRAIPTMTYYSPITGAVGMFRDYTVNADIAVSGIAPTTRLPRATLNTTTAGTICNVGVHWVATAEL